jgi:hypothetical protein
MGFTYTKPLRTSWEPSLLGQDDGYLGPPKIIFPLLYISTLIRQEHE